MNARVNLKDSFMLHIPRRLKLTAFATAAEAVAEYERLRDESGEGASTWPHAKLLTPTETLSISYNGRLWRGDMAVWP